MVFKSNAVSHIGLVRKLNEDAFITRPDIGVWVVADGMGGHAAGEVASKAVVAAVNELEFDSNFEKFVDSARHAIKRVNRELHQLADTYLPRRAPGSTIVILMMNQSRGALIWVGDSRIYRYRDQQLTQLTLDHSHVQDLVNQNLINTEDAETHPMANIITRAIGVHDFIEVDTQLISVLPGDRFLLCTDGLNRVVSNSDIASTMNDTDNKKIVESLLQKTLDNGAPDNVTIVLVEVAGV